jgi:putative proteasome-type protease
MTYCLGILVREGLVMIADTRTNAGLDNIATFRKLHLFERPGERAVALSTAGNLSVSQSVVSRAVEGMKNPATNEVETIMTVPTMFAAAQLVGRAIREVHRLDGQSLEAQAGGFEVSMILGGQVKGDGMRLFMLYSAGNFIEATSDTPYLQIGEHNTASRSSTAR